MTKNTKRGRPALVRSDLGNSPQVSVRVSKHTMSRLKELEDKTDLPMSVMVRAAVELFLDDPKGMLASLALGGKARVELREGEQKELPFDEPG